MNWLAFYVSQIRIPSAKRKAVRCGENRSTTNRPKENKKERPCGRLLFEGGSSLSSDTEFHKSPYKLLSGLTAAPLRLGFLSLALPSEIIIALCAWFVNTFLSIF